ncbi:MAG: CRISPR-associated protein Csx16 [Mariprofundales bacterium]|nr:CRISPR-associated protein Csx16 [Mariprofundales bacterium]
MSGAMGQRQTLFVSRHPGMVEWARQQGVVVDERITHLSAVRLAALRPGDRVIGTLPVHLAAKVCQRGGHYLHLSLDLPSDLRGKELTAADMRHCNARLEEYGVTKV